MSGPTREQLAACIDHTLLRPEATGPDVVRLCREALDLGVFAVCVSPTLVAVAASELAGRRVEVASVIGFPSGAHLPAVKAEEARRAVGDGASELDMVIDLGAAAAGHWDRVTEEVSAVRAAAPAPTRLKVIVESALWSPDQLGRACDAAVAGGADMVKTSTGFHPSGGATAAAVALMAERAGPAVGVKASGGISSARQALEMVAAGATRLGLSRSALILAELDPSGPGEGPDADRRRPPGR